MVVPPRFRSLWSKYVERFPTLGFLAFKPSGYGWTKSRKVAFHLHSTCFVTEEAKSRSRQESAQMSRRREVHR